MKKYLLLVTPRLKARQKVHKQNEAITREPLVVSTMSTTIEDLQ